VQVLEEVRRPPHDEPRVYRRSSKITVLGVTFFYVMVNLAFVSSLVITVPSPHANGKGKFSAIPTEDMIEASDTLTLFFANVSTTT
jgi:hypothetical protein